MLPPHQAVMEAAISSSLSHPNICSTFTYSLNEMKDSKPQSIESSEDSKNSGSLSPTPKAARHLGYEVQLVLEVRCLDLEYQGISGYIDPISSISHLSNPL